MKTLLYKVNGCIQCGECCPCPVKVGQRVILDLDNASVSGLPDKLFATVVSITPHAVSSFRGNTYGFEYDETLLLPSTLIELRQCDILDVPVCLSCCDELDLRIDALGAPHPPASITNNPAPFAANPATQVFNIPRTDVSVSGNTLTVTLGGVPTTFTPVFPTGVSADVGNLLSNGVDGKPFVDCAALQACLDANIASVTFNPVSRVLTITDNLGNIYTSTVPDADTKITSAVFDAITRFLTITDTAGNSFAVTIPDIKVASTTFNTTTRVLTITDTAGATFPVTIPDTNTKNATLVFNNVSRNLTLTDTDGTALVANIPDADTTNASLLFDNVTRVLTLFDSENNVVTATIPDADTKIDSVIFDPISRDLAITDIDSNGGLNAYVVNIPDNDTKNVSLVHDPLNGDLTIVDSIGGTLTTNIPDIKVASLIFDNGTRDLTLIDTAGNTFTTNIFDADTKLLDFTFDSSTGLLQVSDDSTTLSVTLPLEHRIQVSNVGCAIRLTEWSGDGTTIDLVDLGRTNTFGAGVSVTGNPGGDYTIHNLRGENDGTAINTKTLNTAQKVLVVETLAACNRTSTIRVEDWVSNTVMVDGVFGNDSTAQRERSDTPFLTTAAAHTAAVAGDQIHVNPGSYPSFAISKAVEIEAHGVTFAGMTASGASVKVDGFPNMVMPALNQNALFSNAAKFTGKFGDFTGTAFLFNGNIDFKADRMAGADTYTVIFQSSTGSASIGDVVHTGPAAQAGGVSVADCAFTVEFKSITSTTGVALSIYSFPGGPVYSTGLHNGVFVTGQKIISATANAAVWIDGGNNLTTCYATVDVRSIYNSNNVGLNVGNYCVARVIGARIQGAHAVNMEGGTSIQQLKIDNCVLISTTGLFSINAAGGSLGRQVWSNGVQANLPYHPAIIQMAGTAPYVNAGIN